MKTRSGALQATFACSVSLFFDTYTAVCLQLPGAK